MPPSFGEYVQFFWQLVKGQRTANEREALALKVNDLLPYMNLSGPLNVLDLANGSLRPQYLLLQAQGHKVIGVDLVNRSDKTWRGYAYRLARWLYVCYVHPTHTPLQGGLVCGNAGWLPLASDFFDLAVSNAAFEHFLDVPRVTAEMARVLRPGGLAWIGIHLFTSLSGAHNVQFLSGPVQKLPPGVDPWDHLRQRRLPFSVPLNEWRLEQYAGVFEQHFNILNRYCYLSEGEHLLTPELEAELSAFTRIELTSATYVFVLKKRVPSPGGVRPALP